MPIHRSRPASGFAQIPNYMLRDQRLSYLTRGVLAEILSRPDDWHTTADDIAAGASARGGHGEGRDKIRAAFAELEACGYLKRERTRDGRGRMRTELHFYDQAAPTPEHQASVRPTRKAVSAGGTDDGTGSRRRRSAMRPNAIPAGGTDDGSPVVGQPGVGSPVVGQSGVYTNTEDEHPLPARQAAVLSFALPDSGEGNGNRDQERTPDAVAALVDRVKTIRPDWPRTRIRRVLDHPNVADRPWRLVVVAYPAMAGDPASKHPGRLAADGPWWAVQAAPGAVLAAKPERCGQCDENRHIETPQGMKRCPACHPLTTGRAAS